MFGERLREERERLKLSQSDFGEACGVKNLHNSTTKKASVALMLPILKKPLI